MYKILFVSLLLIISCGNAFASEEAVYLDEQTGLMWQLEDNGVDISWPAAKAFCTQLTTAGFSDWRMPTQDELATLYRLEAAEITEYYILPKISISACCQWADNTKNVKVASFDFEYGNRDWGHPMSTVEARVIAVRSIK